MLMWLAAMMLGCAEVPRDPLATAKAVIAAHPSEPIDPCSPDNWAFDALDQLNLAVKDDHDRTIREILRRDPRMEPLASEALFRRWMQMHRAALDTDNRIRTFLLSALSWHSGARKLTFAERNGAWLEQSGQQAPGSWKVSDGKVELEVGGQKHSGTVAPTDYWLTLDFGAFGLWLPDPEIGDCG